MSEKLCPTCGESYVSSLKYCSKQCMWEMNARRGRERYHIQCGKPVDLSTPTKNWGKRECIRTRNRPQSIICECLRCGFGYTKSRISDTSLYCPECKPIAKREIREQGYADVWIKRTLDAGFLPERTIEEWVYFWNHNPDMFDAFIYGLSLDTNTASHIKHRHRKLAMEYAAA